MPRHFTRRQFLRSGIAFGLGLGLAGLTGKAVNARGIAQGMKIMATQLSRGVRSVHDPVVIKADDAYYLFSTGRGILIRRSTDLVEWKRPFPNVVFARNPEWTQEMVPGSTDIWAPDISFFNGKYHLYYSVSTFGDNRSAIGLATNLTLDSEADDYDWVDEGVVVASDHDDDFNAIDPNLIIDDEGVPWLAFGSFWSGIKLRRLDYDTGKPSDEDTTLYSLAQRQVNDGSVEAPFIIRHDGYFYLFVSFDFCCRGADSTYRVMVGRSDAVTGPYVDRDGVPMMEGGGTQVTFATDRWRGPGHNAILQEEDGDYIFYHAYDADNLESPTLRIDPLLWDEDGWPFIEQTTDTE